MISLLFSQKSSIIWKGSKYTFDYSTALKKMMIFRKTDKHSKDEK